MTKKLTAKQKKNRPPKEPCSVCGKPLGKYSFGHHTRCIMGYKPRRVKLDVDKIHAGTHGLPNGKVFR